MLPKPFRGLRWKLTLSYTLVTVGALLVVQIVGLAAAVIFIQNERFLPRLGAQVVAGSAEQIADALNQEPPDIERLDSWLERVANRGFRIKNEYGGGATFNLRSLADDSMEIFILDRGGQVVAKVPRGGGSTPASIDTSQTPELNRLVDQALAEASNPDQLFTVTQDDILLIAAPVRTRDSRTVGAIVFRGSVAISEPPLPGLMQMFVVSLACFTVAAGLVGTAFGFFTARGLSRRLGNISQTADAWSRGDFSAQVGDRSADELSQLAENLNRMAGQLQAQLQTRQDLAALEERNRLARDLHDSVKQQAFAISMNLGAAQALWERDPEGARSRVDAAASLARQAQNELTALIGTLRPAPLEGRGLKGALGEFVQAWQKSTGIQVTLEAEDIQEIAPEVEQALFRIAQEGLSNIARHSGARTVWLNLRCEDRTVLLEIRDDGCGFDPGRPSNGLGLKSMSERAQALGGKLHLESSDRGTRLLVKLPFFLE